MQSTSCGQGVGTVAESPEQWFDHMIKNCFGYATAARETGRPLVGIMCEYAPRELIMAAGALPVCLCGGHAEMIPPVETVLPSNLCPLIKSTFGFHVQHANPFLEQAALVVGETTCDGKKKMFELLGESRAIHVMELPQKPDDPDSLDRWDLELRRLRRALEQRFGVEITDDKLRDAIRVMNRERRLRRELASLMKRSPPPFSGRRLLSFQSIMSGMPQDFEQYERALAGYKDAPGDPALASRTRVLLTGVPIVHGAERVLELIEARGGVVVCMESCTGLKPILENVDENAADPVRALAEKYYHLPCSVMLQNDRRMETLRTLAAEYKAECVVELVWQFCLTYDVESQRVRKLAEQELKLPYLKIETDYSPSDSERIGVRVEALFETVRHAACRN